MGILAILKILLYLVGSIQLAFLISVPKIRIGNTNYLRAMFFGFAIYSYTYLLFYQTNNIFIARLITTSGLIVGFYSAMFFVSLTGLKIGRLWFEVFKYLSLAIFVITLLTNVYPNPHIVEGHFIAEINGFTYLYTLYIIIGYIFIIMNNVVLNRSKNRNLQSLVYSLLIFAAIAIVIDAFLPLFILDIGPYTLIAPTSSAIFTGVFFYQIHKASDIEIHQSITRFSYILFCLLAVGTLFAINTTFAMIRFAAFLILVTTAAIVYSVIKREQAQHKILYITHLATAAYLSDIAHRLKTPLAIIQTQSSPDQPVTTANLHKINEVAKTTVATLRNIVQTGKIDAELVKLDCKTIDLSDWLEQQHSELVAIAPEHTVNIETHGRLPASIDSLFLREALYNLVDNARKFSPTGSIIMISARSVHGQIEITVQDHGSGINPKDLTHIFERHFQADGTRQQFAGSAGLGLSLVKWVAEAHGGHVEATSTLNQGTTFTIQLPALISNKTHHSIRQIAIEE